MDEEERFSTASSPESERPNDAEPDEVMEDADEGEQDNNEDDDDNNDNDDNEADNDDTQKGSAEQQQQQPTESRRSEPPALSDFKRRLRPRIRPEAVTAQLYDIVPTMAAPQSTSVNCMSITPDLRYWMTGGSDGYIRKYDGPGTINGKLALTVAQRHPFVDSVTKAGILMSYWENEEPPAPGRDAEHNLSPVYALAVHSEALWLLSGLESGGINLQSVRHDEGKKIACLQKHTNAVSSLMLAPDEFSVLSGGWDKNIFDWDLNTGTVIRSFDGSGGQISGIELRPASGDPVPVESDEPLPSNTMSTNNAAPITNGGPVHEAKGGGDVTEAPAADEASPAHESLFGGSDAGSLFGETAGDDQPFGNDDDGYAPVGMSEHEGGMDHSADFAMADSVQPEPSEPAMDVDKPAEATAPPPAPEPAAESAAEPVAEPVPEPVPEPVAEAAAEPQVGPPEGPAANAIEVKLEDGQASREAQQLAEETAALKRSQSPAARGLPTQFDQSQTSATTFLSSAMDGTIRIWDRRAPNAVARIGTRAGVPPWCMSACWSPDGNMIYAGRRNGTVEEFDVRHAKRGWQPERTMKFPAGSGAVSAVRAMPNGRHLVCASHDILRLYDLRDTSTSKHSSVPFLIIPGPPRGGVISSLYIDPTSTFMLSTAGTRGWDGTSTEVLVGYEINVTE